MHVVGVVGSALRSGRTRQAVEVALAATVEQPENTSDLIDLSTDAVSIFDGRPAEQYADSTSTVISRISRGDAFILASPIYRGTYTGALKNVLDHLPLEVLEGRVIGVIATGATSHHYLAIDCQFRSVLAWFNAYVLPGSVYLDHAAFGEGKLVEPAGRACLNELGRSVVMVATKLQGVLPGPACLARESINRAATKR